MKRKLRETAINVSNRKKLPKICIVTYLFAALSLVLYFIFTCSVPFSDWFNRSISAYLRAALGMLTAWIPFSLAEILLILLPVWIFLLIRLAVKKYSASRKDAAVYLGILLSIVATVGTLFVFTFAPGYYGSTLEHRLGLERAKVSARELYDTAEALREELELLTPDVTFSSDGASVMPYSLAEMNKKLSAAYEKFAQKNSCLFHFPSRIKPVLLSEAMSYTHITGVYTFFTGEANLNVHFPDYTLPYTAAHELAHQRGIAREDEANFIAYLVCIESEDVYLRYSATLSLYEYVTSALSRADRTLYKETCGKLSREILLEEDAYARFFEKYRDNVVADISEAANNAYLQSQGSPEGTRSYNLVVDLAVAYHKQKNT